MKLQMTAAEILREYRAAKNPKEQIRILADLNACAPHVIVDILRGCGEKIDGRSVPKSAKKPKPAPEPAPAAETQQAAPERCEVAAEPEPAPESLPQHARCMTAGVLAALLAKVDPDAPVRLDGEGYAGWIHVSVAYDAAGEQTEAEICIHPLHQ